MMVNLNDPRFRAVRREVLRLGLLMTVAMDGTRVVFTLERGDGAIFKFDSIDEVEAFAMGYADELIRRANK